MSPVWGAVTDVLLSAAVIITGFTVRGLVTRIENLERRK